MDESTLRNYFRKVLGVAPGASRRELKQCRDKRAQRWRAALVAPKLNAMPSPGDAASLANSPEGRLAITNTAYDCLTNAEKFSDFQSRLASEEVHLPDIESLLATLGVANIKPPAPRVVAKRQAQMQEKMERITALVTESVKKTGHDQALKLTSGKLPDADAFYDAVYKAARDAGNSTCADEMSQLSKSNFEVDESFKTELESIIIDQAEMIAHKEYDRLEDKAAMTSPSRPMPRVVALGLSAIIMGMVVSVCFYGATSQPAANQYGVPNNIAMPANVAGTNVPVTTGPNAPAPDVAPNFDATPNLIPAAPAAGIANSVFNRSVIGSANNQAQQPAQSARTSQNGAAPVAPAVSPYHALTPAEVAAAETLPAASAAPPPPHVTSEVLVGRAGAAGLAGFPTSTATGPGIKLYSAGIDAAMKSSYDESFNDFCQSQAASPSVEAVYNQGVILALQGRFERAIAAYSQLLSSTPTFPQALYNRGLAHQLLADAALQSKKTAEWRKQLNIAIKNYDLAIKANPNMGQAFYNRGLAFYALGQMENATSEFGRASSSPVFMPAAGYNRDLIDLSLKKRNVPPNMPVPSAPIGPVGPPGPA